MIKSFFQKAGALLIMPLFIIFFFFACVWAQQENKSGRLVGGHCDYKSYPGQAVILSIASSKPSDQDKIERFEVKFSFTPQKKIEENFVRVEGKSFNLYDNNFQYPDRKYLTANNIQVGRILNGSLQVIVSGTCTPVLFNFPVLQQGN